MEKLTFSQEKVISKLLHYSKNEEFSQFILETIGKHNWTRGILSDADPYLTDEQEDLYESLGGGYTSEEIDKYLEEGDIRFGISEKLKEQGVTHYLYENEDYLEEIRTGNIICEGIDIDDIKNIIYG